MENLAAYVTRLSAAPASTIAADVRADPERLAMAVHQAVLVSCPGPEPSAERERPRPVIVVDQFEELFTLCRDPAERALFADALAHAAQHRALVVIGMRADFFSQCARIPALVDALGSAIVVGPMTEPQLREKIEGPAERGGWRLGPGLAETILADLRDPAGTLPLLSHVLAATWTRRRGHVRRVLLHLVAVGERTDDTRRRLNRDEPMDRFEPDHAPAARAVIDALLAKRLLVADRDTMRRDVAQLLPGSTACSGS